MISILSNSLGVVEATAHPLLNSTMVLYKEQPINATAKETNTSENIEESS